MSSPEGRWGGQRLKGDGRKERKERKEGWREGRRRDDRRKERGKRSREGERREEGKERARELMRGNKKTATEKKEENILQPTWEKG